MFKIYFQNSDGEFRILDNATNSIITSKYQPKDINAFALFKGYDTTDDGLRKYNEDFNTWCTELKNNPFLSIVYSKYFSHHSAVEMTFKRLCKGKYESHDSITAIEGKWSDMCNNGGLMYCDKGIHESFGYDGKNFYASILGSDDFKFPSKQGNEINLTELPANFDELKYGYYKVSITSQDEHFKKVFAFSQHHVYTNTSLKQAKKFQKHFNVNIKLFQNGKPNAYIYSDDCIVSSSCIFGKWYRVLNQVKHMYPKNKLIKHLQSSLWGHISRASRINKTYEEIQKEGLIIGRTDKADYLIEDHLMFNDKEYYILIDRLNPYKYNLRLKSFVTAFGRNIMSQVAMLSLDNVVRIQTDGVVFKKTVHMTDTTFVPEAKTTGLINWYHVNKGVHV